MANAWYSPDAPGSPQAEERRAVERLLSTEEVADVLGRPPRTLRQWRYLGEGPRYLKVGAPVRYRAHDVEAWLKAQEQEPAARGR
jgi:predicted DNA-binding transcriptional regulator AlpA